MKYLICWLSTILISLSAFAQNGEVRGFVYEKESGEPIIYSPVYLQGTTYGAVTDGNGYYSLTKIPAGDYTLMATSLGYDSALVALTIEEGKVLSRNLYLGEITQQLNEVTITESRQAYKAENLNVSVTQIQPREIKRLPSIGGEPDLAQYIQTIPGVVSTGDQGGQIFIRGGAPVQTLTLLDNMWIYNPFHSIGLFSVFDTDIMRSADVYTAGFGAEYGGRTSAVIDIKTIDGNKKRLSGNVGINPFATSATLEGPLVKKEDGSGVTFLLNGRHSLLDQTSRTLYQYAEDEPGEGIPFGFTDGYGKITLHSDKGSKLSLFGFNFTDFAKLSRVSAFDWDSYGGGANFLLLPSGSSVLINGYVAYSTYEVTATSGSDLPRNSSVSGLNGGFDFTYFKGRNEVKYGLGIITNSTDFLAYTPLRQAVAFAENNIEAFGYFKYKIVKDKFVIDPGIRLHYYTTLNVPSLEPRIGAKYNVSPRFRLKAAGGLYSQNLISTRSDRDVVNLFNGYLSTIQDASDGNGGTVSTPLEKSTHAVVGFEFDVTENLELNVETYTKQFRDVPNVNRQQLFPADPDFILESGDAVGIDFLLRYQSRNLLIQGGYSWPK